LAAKTDEKKQRYIVVTRIKSEEDMRVKEQEKQAAELVILVIYLRGNRWCVLVILVIYLRGYRWCVLVILVIYLRGYRWCVLVILVIYHSSVHSRNSKMRGQYSPLRIKFRGDQ
jgi:hypothetical protein